MVQFCRGYISRGYIPYNPFLLGGVVGDKSAFYKEGVVGEERDKT